MTELIRSTHPAFRPVDVKMGPDGALYIVDWYNPIIQHGEVDFRDPRRDHTHGRIWRVTAKNRPLVPSPHLLTASPAELLEDLKEPETWTRTHAKRVMLEKHRSVMEPLLDKWLVSLNPADPNVEHYRLEAAWTYQTLDKTRPDLLRTLLQAHDARIRAAALRILAFWQPEMPDALALLRHAVKDSEPQVRLEAVRTLAANTAPEAVLVALQRWINQSINTSITPCIQQYAISNRVGLARSEPANSILAIRLAIFSLPSARWHRLMR